MSGSAGVGKVYLEEQRKYFDSRLYRQEDVRALVGQAYKDHTGGILTIKDAVKLKKPGHIADGLALLLSDGYWRFGVSDVAVNGVQND
jgi:hypothetical protein